MQLKLVCILFFILGCQNKKANYPLKNLLYQSNIAYLKSRGLINDLDNKLLKIKCETQDEIAVVEIIKGNQNMISTDWPKAILNYTKAISFLKNSKTDSLSLLSYFGVGSANLQIGNFEEALQWFLKAEKFSINKKLTNMVSNCYFAIAQLFQLKEDLTNAKLFLNKGIKVMEKRDNHNYYNAQLTLANIYGMNGNIDSALIIDYLNLDDLKGKNLVVYETYFYNNIGNCYLYTNKFDSAEKYLIKSLAIDISLKDDKQIADSYGCLMSLYSASKDSVKLKNTAIKAIAYANLTNFFNAKQATYKSLALYYKEIKNYKQALIYQDSAFENYKKRLNEKSENRVSELKVEFETEKKQIEINKQNESIFIQRILIGLILLLFIISVVFFYNFFTKIKIKRELELKNLQFQQIEISNNLIFKTEQSERKRIANDLHDSVGQKLAAVKMQLNTDKLNILSLSNLLDQSINEVRTISHNLVPYDLEKGLQAAIEQIADQINFTNNSTKIKVEVLNVLPFSQKLELICYRIIQECVNNALKHAKATIINIKLEIVDNNLIIHIKDNGIGMNLKDDLNQGIGLKSIKSRVKQLNGKLELKSKLQLGTEFKIWFSI